jgi:hypothetical protein
VAAPLGEGYTVAEQLNAPDERGNIQLEIYPCLADSVSCVDTTGACLDLGQAAQELGMEALQTISMHTKCVRSNFIIFEAYILQSPSSSYGC